MYFFFFTFLLFTKKGLGVQPKRTACDQFFQKNLVNTVIH